MHSTPDARLALTCLLVLLATVVLARMGEAHFATRAPAPVAPLAASTRATAQGDALRDGQRIDPNLATAVELEMLPGVGPRLAREIVAERGRAGPFRQPQALRRVRGIGAKLLSKLAPFLRFDSEGLEHAAEAQRDVGRGEALAPLEQQPAAHIDTAHPAPR